MTREEVLQFTGLKKRFCKDCNLPINLFDEPYFTQRLKALDVQFDCVKKFDTFCADLEKYDTEQEYFEYYNTVKDSVINMIKDNTEYMKFLNDDFADVRVVTKNITLGNKNLYIEGNQDKTFISIDMKKANFSALRHYSPAIFKNVETWEQYIGFFTPSEHIRNSKYIRQVILGACNPKRQITFEKYLMSKLTLNVLSKIDIKDKIVFFSNDEIIIDITDMTSQEIDNIKQIFNEFAVVPIRIEDFILKGVYKKDLVFPQFNANDENIAYIKEVTDGTISIKKYQSLYLPMIIKTIKKGNIIDYDLIFDYNDNLCKLIETPDIYIKE